MQEQSTVTRSLFILQGILATIVTALMFYPMFGGALMFLNGTFIYFSYFLAVFLVVIIGIIDFIQLIHIKKTKSEVAKRYNTFSYIFISLMIMIGLLEGRYIFSPLLAIIYIFLMLMQLFQIADNNSAFFKINVFDVIQRVCFYLTAIVLLLGNQPFEVMGIPVATTALFLFVFVSVVNFIEKIRKV